MFTQHRRSLAPLALATAAVASVIGHADASVVIVGSISSSDFLAIDSTGETFHYDLYEVSNPTADAILVTATLTGAHTEDLGLPWMAYWSSPVLPTFDWESPSDIYSLAEEIVAGSQVISLTPFLLPAGATYQLAVSTWYYIEDGAYLDGYTLELDGDGVEVSQVPGPGPLAIVAMAAMLRRRRR